MLGLTWLGHLHSSAVSSTWAQETSQESALWWLAEEQERARVISHQKVDCLPGWQMRLMDGKFEHWLGAKLVLVLEPSISVL